MYRSWGVQVLSARAFGGIRGLAALAAGLVALPEPSIAQQQIHRLFDETGPYTLMNGHSRINPYGSRPGGYEEHWRPMDATTYRTMCVRLCDGFYFPISFGARREFFYRDNRACMKRCDGKARLFFYPTLGGSIAEMVDLTGRKYRTLSNAYRYRKSRVSGCTCQAEPWSAESKARHLEYAAQEAEHSTVSLPEKKQAVKPVATVRSRRDFRSLQSYRQHSRHFSRRPERHVGYVGWAPRQWRRHD